MKSEIKYYNAYQVGLYKAAEWGLEGEYTNELLRLLMEFDFNEDIGMAINLALAEWDISPISWEKEIANE